MFVSALSKPKVRAKNIHKDLSDEELRALARKDEITTKYGSAVYITQVRNRSAKNTYVIEDGVEVGADQQGIPKAKAEAIIRDVHDYLRTTELVQVDRFLGTTAAFRIPCRLFVTKPFARLAYIWNKSLFLSDASVEPEFVTIYVPEWKERIILVHPEAGFTYVLGTDYFGEAKKSFLRMGMYRTKKRGGIGLHAGAKILRVKKNGRVEEVGFILFGLSGTGKTTLTLHHHDLKGDEGIAIRQDDVVMMREDGYCYGTEDSFFIKTEGLEPSQEVLYYAATRPHAAFENVKVREDGEIDFLNYELTTNGRGIVRRADIAHTDDEIDLPKANKIIFITRRDDVMPVAARLSPVQAACYFMLGESIETSAGDPTKAGQAKRCVGTNPFIIGPEAVEGERILKILTENQDMECYLLNTGAVGKGPKSTKGEKITIKVSTTLMREIARETITWKEDPDWGYLVPERVPGLDLEKYDPHNYYTEAEYQQRVNQLRMDRIAWLNKYPGLPSEIIEAIS